MISDDPLLVHLKLVRAGYASSIREAEDLPARKVLQAMAYEKFVDEYESTYWELNRCQKE